LNILLDHNLDRRLKQYLTGYTVATVQERGCSDILNGELLELAESNGFEVLLTADTNIKAQQNFSERRIALLVMRSFNNRLSTHVEMVDDIRRALMTISPGEIIEVFHRDMA
jgi:predicted nuclease of predicted toxin-antitoxin system